MNDMKKQFEEWAEGGGYDLSVIDTDCVCYVNVDTEIAWQAWQASRSALVVELPEYEPNNHHRNILIDEVKSALDAAGVAYK